MEDTDGIFFGEKKGKETTGHLTEKDR